MRPEAFTFRELEAVRGVQRDRAAGRVVRSEIFIVGRTVVISPALQAVIASHPRGGPPLWTLKNRFSVLAHWRWQPIGARLPKGYEGPRNARKTLIQLYWKGPEGAAAWQHIYEVTADHEVSL